jgi:CheY-like chemotaxis protein
MTTLLLIEDNPNHLAEAKALLEDRITVRAISGVDYATNLTEAEELLRTRKYDGIISDVFFPKETGGTEQQLGTTIGQYALDNKIPFVLVTSTHHHGYKTEPVTHWIRARGMNLVDAADLKDRNIEANYKSWCCGYTAIMYLIENKFDLSKNVDWRLFVLEVQDGRFFRTLYDEDLLFREVVKKYCSGMFDNLIQK